MKTFTSIEEFEAAYFPNDVKRYPVVFRRRVTKKESQLIDEWLTKHRDGIKIGEINKPIVEKRVAPKHIKKEPVPKPPTRADIIIERLRKTHHIDRSESGYELFGSGEPVVVKTCTDIVEYGRTGRFVIDRKPHEKLVERNGLYLFVVVKPNGDDFDILLHRLMPAAHIIDKTNGLRIKAHPIKIWGEKACVAAGLNVVPWSSRTAESVDQSI